MRSAFSAVFILLDLFKLSPSLTKNGGTSLQVKGQKPVTERYWCLLVFMLDCQGVANSGLIANAE